MKNNLFFVALLFVLLACASNKKAPLSLQNLSTSVNQAPLFSWQLHSDQRNQSQSAYQIQIANTPEDLKNTNGAIWDSGKTSSAQSVLVTASSLELKPAQTYFWKVKVWNQDDQESEWSETASFHTGLLSEPDWQNAKWIGYKELPAEKKMVPGIHGSGDKLGDLCVDRPVVPLFRKEFVVDRTIKEATLYISGLGHYEASINGQKVGNSFLAPGWTNYNKTVFYNSYDVSSMLQQGKNAIGVVVGNGFYNINRERYRKLVIAWGNPMLIGQLRIRFTDGTEQIWSPDRIGKPRHRPLLIPVFMAAKITMLNSNNLVGTKLILTNSCGKMRYWLLPPPEN